MSLCVGSASIIDLHNAPVHDVYPVGVDYSIGERSKHADYTGSIHSCPAHATIVLSSIVDSRNTAVDYSIVVVD